MGGLVSMLSVLGLALGAGLLITVLSVMNGFDRELRVKILALVPHIRLLPDVSLELAAADMQFVRADADVIAVTPFAELTGMVRSRGEAAPVLVWAVNPQMELDEGVWKAQLGSDLFVDLQSRPGVYLGAALAEDLNAQPGQSITLLAPDGDSARYAGYTLLGTFATGTELDHRLMITSLDTLADSPMSGLAKGGFSVYSKRVFDAYSHAYKLLGQLPAGYRATTWASTHGNLFEAIQMSRYLVGLIVFLLLGIAAFNVVGSLMIATADRQSDIAILKTLGADRLTLIRIFTLQGFLIGCLGASAGLLLGLGLSAVVAPGVNLLEHLLQIHFLRSNIYPLDYLPVDLRWSQVFGVSIVAIILSTLGALYPAIRVLSVKPADTLRYE